MRLPANTVQAIRETVTGEAGADATIYLFGSRLNDAARGGDVDLYVECDAPLSRLRLAALKLRLETLLALPVDLVVASRNTVPTPFQRIARHGAIRL